MLDIVATIIGKDQFILVVVFDPEDYLWMKDYLQLDGLVP
jgi:hypothetical protein